MSSQKPKLRVQNISCIIPEDSVFGGVFLGNIYGAQDAQILKEYGIRAVLTSSIETDISYNACDIPFHMIIPAHDKQEYNIRTHINECIHFIEQSRKFTNVLIHCYAGVSRSVSITCAYIMWKFKWNFETTMAFVRAKRVVAKPNDGFVKQLMQIEKAMMSTSYSQRKQEKEKKQVKVAIPPSSQMVQSIYQPQPQPQFIGTPTRSLSTPPQAVYRSQIVTPTQIQTQPERPFQPSHSRNDSHPISLTSEHNRNDNMPLATTSTNKFPAVYNHNQKQPPMLNSYITSDENIRKYKQNVMIMREEPPQVSANLQNFQNDGEQDINSSNSRIKYKYAKSSTTGLGTKMEASQSFPAPVPIQQAYYDSNQQSSTNNSFIGGNTNSSMLWMKQYQSQPHPQVGEHYSYQYHQKHILNNGGGKAPQTQPVLFPNTSNSTSSISNISNIPSKTLNRSPSMDGNSNIYLSAADQQHLYYQQQQLQQHSPQVRHPALNATESVYKTGRRHSVDYQMLNTQHNSQFQKIRNHAQAQGYGQGQSKGYYNDDHQNQKSKSRIDFSTNTKSKIKAKGKKQPYQNLMTATNQQNLSDHQMFSNTVDNNNHNSLISRGPVGDNGQSRNSGNSPFRVLGGKSKTPHKHNAIPIPKAVQKMPFNGAQQFSTGNSRKKIQKTHPSYALSNSFQRNSNPRNGQQPKNIYASEDYFLKNSGQLSNHMYQGGNNSFYQPRQNSKSNSRCLIRPKDLPGYKKMV